MSCDHISKVLQWGLDDAFKQVVKLYGCLNCDATSEKPFPSGIKSEHTHTQYTEGCFACKASTLQLNPGDAGSNMAMSNKRWNRELDAYSEARSQGIQPAGTRLGQIEAAVEASDKLGKAYDAGTMPKAESITKAHGAVMKEVGM
jgi:hypothetical protein